MFLKFDEIFTYKHLLNSYFNCRKGVCWKQSVQKFNSQFSFNVYKLYKQLRERKWEHKDYYEFDKIESGKQRHIQAEYFSDRIVQRCFCDYSLIPLLSKSLIYDNAACQKNKGIDFAIKRCKYHLLKHMSKYGNQGYILQFDFHHYFESIPKTKVYEILDKLYEDKEVVKVATSMLDKYKSTGLGLGSQLSQTIGIYYPNKLDHKIKEYFRMKFYGRYMDDGYIICESKEKLLEILSYLKQWCKEYGITLNDKKTSIIKLSKGFTFLKKKFIINDNKIIIKIDKKNVHRMKRKIKNLKNKLPENYTKQLVYSWTQTLIKYNCWKQLLNIKNYIRRIYNGTR